MKCSVCGCENEEGIAICSECGNALQSATVTCCHCGKQIRPTAKYCVYCGGNQAQPPVEEVPAEEVPVCVIAEAPVTESVPVEEEIPTAVEEAAPAAEEASAAAPAPQIIYVPQVVAPAYKLPTGRGFWKMVLLGIITGMLYPMVIMSRISVEINMVASRHDGKRTMHFMWMPFISVLTLGVYFFVWIHTLCGRIGAELRRRQIAYKFGAGSFWLWNLLYGIVGSIITAIVVLILGQTVSMETPLLALIGSAGALISSIGPCIFLHKLMRSMNLVNADYNEKG